MGRIRKHGPLVIVIMALLVSSFACTLSSSSAYPTPVSNPTLIPTTVFAPPTPVVVVPSATPVIPPTPIATLVPTAIPCYLQTTWPVYTVKQGDTLSTLAALIGTNVDTLVQANCLPDANQITEGQGLYMPMLPATPVPPATAAVPATVVSPSVASLPTNTLMYMVPVFLDNLVVERHWPGASGQWVTYSQAVRVNAGDIDNVLRVKFFVNDHANNNLTTFIGQDDTPWDGAYMDYTFPHPGWFTFQAMAENDVANASSTVYTILYDPNFVPPEGQYNLLGMTPTLGFDGTTTILAANGTVMISWSHAPLGALRVEFVWYATNAPAGSAGTVINTDTVAADGALVTWQVPWGAAGYLQGLAYMPDGSQIASRPAEFRAQ